MNLEALCKEAGVKLYDTELTKENGKKIYRIFIFKDGGVNLDDCARLSEILSPIFDVEDPFDEEYFLEISSPGLERKLHTLDHFSKSIGEKVKISTKDNEKIQGEILAVKDSCIFLRTGQAQTISLEFHNIKKTKNFVERKN